MKIAVFSDIHSNLEALEAIIEDIKKNDFDKIICLGDTIGLATNPKECLELLFKNDIKVLLGNHDLYYLYGSDIDPEITEEEMKHNCWIKDKLNNNYLDKLKNCDLDYTIKYKNKRISFKHFFIKDKNSKYPFYNLGILYNDKINQILIENSSDINIYGHEHKPTNFKYRDKVGLGIGSSGCVLTDETFYTIIDIDDKIIINKKYLAFDRNKFVTKIKKDKYPEREFIAKIFFGIDI